jgi:two-component system, OmpR family, sensor histidine kinase MtrB
VTEANEGRVSAVRRLVRRPRLRTRVTVLFGLGGLGVSVLLAMITYTLADRYLVAQRERSAIRQTFLNARALRDDLLAPGQDVSDALTALELPQTSSVVFKQGDQWYSSSVSVGRSTVPRSMRVLVTGGTPAHQRVDVDGRRVLIVGLDVPAVDGTYFEVFSLAELGSTLDVIRDALIGAAAATTVVAMLFGFFASRRVLQPLAAVGATAVEIAEGDLARRLERSDDPDLGELTESFNRMVDALQARIERDARFASSVSHELRSPLTTLAAASELIAKHADEFSAGTRTAVEVLVRDVHRFQRLVQDLLELSRAESGVDEVSVEPVRFADLVLHTSAHTSGSTFTFDVDREVADVPLLTDKRRVERIVTNLLENAQSHGEGVERVGIARDGDWVCIAIDDRGPGVPAEDRERLFERFYRGAAAGRRDGSPGTGLGLALVAEHLRLLEGSVTVTDAPGGGARFEVRLPWSPA